MNKYSTQSRLKGMINRKKRLTNTIFFSKIATFLEIEPVSRHKTESSSVALLVLTIGLDQVTTQIRRTQEGVGTGSVLSSFHLLLSGKVRLMQGSRLTACEGINIPSLRDLIAFQNDLNKKRLAT